MAEPSSSRITLDTPDQQREQRLKKRREREQQNRDVETASERRTRLDKRNAYNQKRKASETPESREIRLQQQRESISFYDRRSESSKATPNETV